MLKHTIIVSPVDCCRTYIQCIAMWIIPNSQIRLPIGGNKCFKEELHMLQIHKKNRVNSVEAFACSCLCTLALCSCSCSNECTCSTTPGFETEQAAMIPRNIVSTRTSGQQTPNNSARSSASQSA